MGTTTLEEVMSEHTKIQDLQNTFVLLDESCPYELMPLYIETAIKIARNVTGGIFTKNDFKFDTQLHGNSEPPYDIYKPNELVFRYVQFVYQGAFYTGYQGGKIEADQKDDETKSHISVWWSPMVGAREVNVKNSIYKFKGNKHLVERLPFVMLTASEGIYSVYDPVKDITIIRRRSDGTYIYQ